MDETKEKATNDPDQMPGKNLIRAIEQAIVDREIFAGEAAELMGFYPTELSRLRNGKADVTKLPREKLKAIAKFIGAPLLATMLLADQIKPKDFYQSEGDDDSDIQNKIDRAVRYILSDPDWGSVAPKELFDQDTSAEVKLFLVWAYERATGLVLIKGAADYLKMLEELE